MEPAQMPRTLDPEVAGNFGNSSELDTSVHPPRVRRLEYRVEGWLGDDLIQTFPVYLASPGLVDAMTRSGLTGFTDRGAGVVTVDPQVASAVDKKILDFHWIEIDGQQESDDLFITSEYLLGVSDRAWAIFDSFQLEQCDVEQV